MADINVDVRNAEDSSGFVGASRGVTPLQAQEGVKKTSVATAIEAFGSLFELTNKAVDQGIKRDIDKQANAAQEQVFNEFNVGDEVLLRGESIDSEPVPTEISKAEKQLSRLRQAVEQGTITENSYWARVQTNARQLRARYPGHTDYIDQKISELAGGKPQNQILANLLKRAPKDTAEDKYMSTVQKLNQDGNLPPDWSRDKYPTVESLVLYSAPLYRDKAAIDRSVSNINLAKSKGELVDKQVSQAVNKIAINSATRTLNDVTSVFGKDYDSITKAAMDIRNRNTPMTEEETTSIRNQFNRLKQGFRNVVERDIRAQFEGDVVTPKMVEDAVAGAMGPINSMEQALTDKNVGLFLALHNEMEYRKDTDDDTIYKTVPGARSVGAMHRTLGPELATSLYLDATINARTPQQKVMINRGLEYLVGTTEPSVSEAIKNFQGANDPVVAKGLLDSQLSIIKSDKHGPDSKAKAAQALFGTKNASLLTSDVSDNLKNGNGSQRAVLFNQIVNPEMHKKMLELKERGDVQSYDNYVAWSTNTFRALSKQSIDTLAAESLNGGSIVSWNTETKKFELRMRPTVDLGYGDPPVNFGDKPAQTNAINKLNTALSAMESIVKSNNMTMDAFAENIMKTTANKVFEAPMKLGGPKPDIPGTVVVDSRTGLGITPEANRMTPGDPGVFKGTERVSMRGRQMSPEEGDSMLLGEISQQITRKAQDLNLFKSMMMESSTPETIDQVDKTLNELLELVKERDSIQNAWIEQFKRENLSRSAKSSITK